MLRGYLFRANREQLLLPADRGGLGLVDLKLKARALFEKTIIQQYTSENCEVTALHRAVRTNDHILPRHYLQALKGVKQTLTELPAGVSVTTGLLYKHHRRTVNVVPRVQLKRASLHWDTIWKDIADAELPTALRASAYSFVNDLTPTKVRRKRIFLDADDRSVTSDHRDTAIHRVTSCIYSRALWAWCRRRIARRLGVAADDIREETLCFLDLTAFPTVKRRAVVWLLMNLIDFTVSTPTPFHLREFVDRLRRASLEGPLPTQPCVNENFPATETLHRPPAIDNLSTKHSVIASDSLGAGQTPRRHLPTRTTVLCLRQQRPRRRVNMTDAGSVAWRYIYIRRRSSRSCQYIFLVSVYTETNTYVCAAEYEEFQATYFSRQHFHIGRARPEGFADSFWGKLEFKTRVFRKLKTLVHSVFDTTWRTMAQTSPSTVTAGNLCAFDIGIFVHKTIESSVQGFRKVASYREWSTPTTLHDCATWRGTRSNGHYCITLGGSSHNGATDEWKRLQNYHASSREATTEHARKKCLKAVHDKTYTDSGTGFTHRILDYSPAMTLLQAAGDLGQPCCDGTQSPYWILFKVTRIQYGDRVPSQHGCPTPLATCEVIPGDGGTVASALASGGFAAGFSRVGIVLNDTSCRRVFSGYSCFPRPCQRRSILRSHFMSCSGTTGTYGSQLGSPSLGGCCLALGPPHIRIYYY
ncbi:hypothetical protein PR048_026120 [Dryococelus australis]|uniref:Uncharacterized protein n=1 Tax=Dryococelus australis TaxID=614101 RepID=A0ABQ9GKH6_9NEOP|nr:hypothetical protein PR048_026120 [Dryococelus australis]